MKRRSFLTESRRECHARRAFVAARQVVADPCDVAWEAWIETAGGDEDSYEETLRSGYVTC
jgi:DNA-binding SARP family transcriptional activator